MSITTRILHGLNATLLLMLWAGSIGVYPRLPDEIPMHYGFFGMPDRWAATSMARWLLLPFVATFTAGIVYGSAWLMAHMRSGLRMPSQRKYEALSADDQRRVLQVVQHAMYGIAGLMLLLFGALQGGDYAVAVGASETLPTTVNVVMWSALAGTLLLVAGAIVRMRRLVDWLYAQHESSMP